MKNKNMTLKREAEKTSALSSIKLINMDISQIKMHFFLIKDK